jgi:dipeptidyl aminopeptidase/acylaminoacyl peptidase
MPKSLKILISILVDFLLITLVVLIAVSYISAENFLYSNTPAEQPASTETIGSTIVSNLVNGRLDPVSLETYDHVKIQAYYYPPKNGAAIILLHGYQSSHIQMIPLARILMDEDFGVILPDFRGQGASESSLITFGKNEILDVQAAYEFLLQQPEVDSQKIAVFGNSMGGSVAILYSASNPAIKATIAQSPLTSVRDLIGRNTRQTFGITSGIMAPLIQFWIEQRIHTSLDQLEPIQKIHAISPRPVFILMGGKDQIVDPQSVKLLYNAAGEPKKLWYDEGVGHLEFQMVHPGRFEDRITGFLDDTLDVKEKR